MISGAQIHAGTDFTHAPARFVSQHDRERPQACAVDDRQIRMAESRHAHLDEHFAGSGRIEFEFLDRERLALCIGRGQTAFTKDGSECFHGRGSFRLGLPKKSFHVRRSDRNDRNSKAATALFVLPPR